MSRPSHSKSRLILLGLFFCAVVAAYFFSSPKKVISPNHDLKTGMVTVSDKTINVYLAESINEKEAGLSVFDSLPADWGMLFVFDSPQIPGFWMNGMKFAIDIIWIKNNQVVEITKNLPVESNAGLAKYYPNMEIDRALEVNAGWAEENNIKIGDNITQS